MQEQSATIDQVKEIDHCPTKRRILPTLSDNLRKQASQIQKVSAQIEASRSAPQVVENSR